MTETIDTTEALADHVAGLVEAARDYLVEQSKSRRVAMDYYAGKMADLPTREGYSSVVSNDVRATIKKVLPSIMRTIMAGGSIVKYLPVGPEDEEAAEQATDYINLVVVPECGAEKAIYDAIHDAALVKTGILKWCAYRKKRVTVTAYTDQPDEALLGLEGDPTLEVFDHRAEPETDPNVLALMPGAQRNSFKVKRITDRVELSLEAVPRGIFLITPGAKTIEDAELVGEEQFLPRSELVAMGYDKDMVWQIRAHDGGDADDKERMGEDYTTRKAETQKALEIVCVYEVYVRVDADNDGIAEIYRMVYGEGGGEKGGNIVLGLEPVDEAPYAEVVLERDPHQFEGHSVFEDMRQTMRVKTALKRATLDNVYAQNAGRPVIDRGAIQNPEDITNLQFGQPLFLQPGRSAQEVVQWIAPPFFAKNSMDLLAYMDEEARELTGITDRSAGLQADDLSNTSATAAQLLSEAGIAQADMIVRTIANGGLRRAFRGLLKLVIAHADGPRTVQMKGEWAQYDPRAWNVDMDCTVNVGLGGGTKERDMAVLQVIYGLQKELLLAIGPDNPYVKPEQLYNTLEKITETAGFPSAMPYFSKPDPQEVQAKIDAQKNAPNPDVVKIQAQGQVQMQIEQFKAQVQAQLDQAKLQIQAESEKMKAEVARDREMAQMQADLAVKQHDGQVQAQLEAQKTQFEAEKFAAEMAFREKELAMKRELELLKLNAQDTPTGVQSKSDMREGALMDHMKSLTDAMARMNGPKRVVRDANGDVVGVEAVQ